MQAPDFYTPMKLVFIGLILSVPLGIWKLIEIIIWVAKNLSISVK